MSFWTQYKIRWKSNSYSEYEELYLYNSCRITILVWLYQYSQTNLPCKHVITDAEKSLRRALNSSSEDRDHQCLDLQSCTIYCKWCLLMVPQVHGVQDIARLLPHRQSRKSQSQDYCNVQVHIQGEERDKFKEPTGTLSYFEHMHNLLWVRLVFVTHMAKPVLWAGTGRIPASFCPQYDV